MGIYFDIWDIQHKRNNKDFKDIVLDSQNLNSENEIQKRISQKFPEDMHSPELLKDYPLALERIIKAVNNKERIVIFGDYDVDGTVGTTILYSILQQVTKAVSYRIPHRKNDGYGLKKYFIDELAQKNIGLIITVDNGITAVEEVDYARTKNIDVIISDHHIPGKKLPEAYAIINHKQENCHYPFSELCGAALGYKIALGIAKHFLNNDEYKAFAYNNLDIIALATVADCVPIKGENHLLVKTGLEVLKNTNNKGLKQLCKEANIDRESANEETFGFQIGPRINAAGRLKSAYLGVQLLLGKTEFAAELETLNNTRKQMVETAMKEAEKNIIPGQIIIIHSKHWHTGIIGLIAGKLTEKYHLPSIVLEEQNTIMVASCRTVPGFDIYNFLSLFSHFFQRFGGHSQAAGFSILTEKFDTFQQEALKKSQTILLEKPLIKKLSIHGEIYLKELHLDSYKYIQQFAPFGIENTAPIFILKNIHNIQWKVLGKSKEHIIGNISTPQGTIRIIKFFATEIFDILDPETSYNIVCKLGKNCWKNQTQLQLELIDIEKST
jgi:single-stranded-DNA-specific exonuclease